MIKLLLLDFDGVLTNGKKNYSKNGICETKELCDKDFTAIKRFLANNVPVFFLSGDHWNENIFINRNIPYLITRNLKKEECVNIIIDKYNLLLKDCAYIGDDIFDVNLLKIVGYPFCPNDAIIDCKNVSCTLAKKGGENLISHFFEYCKQHNLINFSHDEMENIFSLDAKEKF